MDVPGIITPFPELICCSVKNRAGQNLFQSQIDPLLAVHKLVRFKILFNLVNWNNIELDLRFAFLKIQLTFDFQVQLESLVKTKESISGITLCAKIDKKDFGKHPQNKGNRYIVLFLWIQGKNIIKVALIVTKFLKTFYL